MEDKICEFCGNVIDREVFRQYVDGGKDKLYCYECYVFQNFLKRYSDKIKKMVEDGTI